MRFRSPAGTRSWRPWPWRPSISIVQRPMPGIARRRRQPRSWSAARRSARPVATSRAARRSATARPAERSKLCSSAGAVPARRAASGRSRRPVAGQARPRRKTIRRWIATARGKSMSCSVIAHASASNGSGRRMIRSHGRRRTDGPIRGSERKRSWNSRRSSSTPSAKRMRAIASFAVGSSSARAPKRTSVGPVCATRTTAGAPSTWTSRSRTPPRRRSTPSGAAPGRRNAQHGRTVWRTSGIGAPMLCPAGDGGGGRCRSLRVRVVARGRSVGGYRPKNRVRGYRAATSRTAARAAGPTATTRG